MVIGPESESYRTLRYLVQRLPAMIASAWLENPTQRIAIDGTVSYLLKALELRGRPAQRFRSAARTCSAKVRCSTGWPSSASRTARESSSR
jgi:hypothetical protein